jgi:hypothetical protein
MKWKTSFQDCHIVAWISFIFLSKKIWVHIDSFQYCQSFFPTNSLFQEYQFLGDFYNNRLSLLVNIMEGSCRSSNNVTIKEQNSTRLYSPSPLNLLACLCYCGTHWVLQLSKRIKSRLILLWPTFKSALQKTTLMSIRFLLQSVIQYKLCVKLDLWVWLTL